jgi:hypothetical protein
MTNEIKPDMDLLAAIFDVSSQEEWDDEFSNTHKRQRAMREFGFDQAETCEDLDEKYEAALSAENSAPQPTTGLTREERHARSRTRNARLDLITEVMKIRRQQLTGKTWQEEMDAAFPPNPDAVKRANEQQRLQDAMLGEEWDRGE